MKANVGIIGGTGRIGRLHAENLAFRIPEANLVCISEIKEQIDTARTFGKILGVVSVVEDYGELLDNRGVDAVIICSPTNTHAQIIIEAAQAGKHIFCEKPIAHSLSDIDRALQAVEEAGVKFQVGFNRRFDTEFAKTKQALIEGRIGEPQTIHIVSRDPSPPPPEYIKMSGGMFMDMTIHDFDMVRYLMGEVTELSAYGNVLIDPEIGQLGDIDTAVIMLKFKSGALGTIENSRQAVYGYDQRVEVLGSHGSIATENLTPDKVVISDIDGVHFAKPLHFFMERYAESYEKEMQAFVDAITHNTPTLVSGKDGRIPVVMALAAKKSLKENRPVKLSEIG